MSADTDQFMQAQAAEAAAYDRVRDMPCAICGRTTDRGELPIAIGTAPKFRGVCCPRCWINARQYIPS